MLPSPLWVLEAYMGSRQIRTLGGKVDCREILIRRSVDQMGSGDGLVGRV